MVDCWEWPGQRMDNGSGLIYGKTSEHELAHRALWKLINGVVPPNAYVLHKCDNPVCVNPNHLFLGDHTANMRDMCYKRRDKNGKKTHCINGHLLAGDNLYVQGDRRQCRICQRIRYHKWYEKRKAFARMLAGER